MAKVKAKKMMPMASESYRPEISFDEKDLPQIKSWKVGSKYKLMLTVEQTSLSKDQYDGGKAPMRARFKVISVKVIGGKTGKKVVKHDENEKYGYA